ncbi:MAG: hypothetical protein Q7S84_00740 [bacterium]|nr:hypothetical protein [bacterium]
MSFTNDLFEFFEEFRGPYRVVRYYYSNHYYQIHQTPAQRIADTTFRVTLSRLKQRGLIANTRGAWHITALGKRELLKRAQSRTEQVDIRKKQKSLIIIFDIPESLKAKRNWLRTELVALGFEMLQKSVWFGPGPLPRSFLDKLKNLDLLPYIKFLDARESDII